MSAQSIPSHFRLVSVGEGAFAAVAKEGDRSAVGNAGFVAGSDGVLVVDAFATEDAARELLAEIRKATPAPRASTPYTQPVASGHNTNELATVSQE